MRDPDGFTLVELSVGITLTVLAAGVAFAAFNSVRQAETRWSERLAAENAAHQIVTVVSRDLRSAHQVRTDSTGSWTIQLPSGASVHYEYQGAVLRRDGVAVNAPAVAVTAFDLFTIAASATSPAPPEARPHLGPSVTVMLDVATRRDTLRLATSVALRQVEPWMALPHPSLTHVP